MRERTDSNITPLLMVRKMMKPYATVRCAESVEQVCNHVYEGGPCGHGNCNLALVKIFVANGANPLHEGKYAHGGPEFPVTLDLCENAKAELCLFMYERARDARLC